MRDRKQTEFEIISAVDRVIAGDGFKGLGINSIAKEAGLSKVLIYRYFENLEGLLEAWAVKNSYWVTNVKPPENSDRPVKEIAGEVLSGYGNSLKEDPVKREILRWLLSDEGEVCRKVMAKIEEAGVELTKGFENFAESNSDNDAEAVFAVITAGISYLALIRDRADVYNGIALDNEEGWERIYNAMEKMVALLIE